MDVPPHAPPRPEEPSAGSWPRRLVREPDDRKIAGVCAGLADRLGIDVSLVRLGAILLAIFTPVGLIAYLVGWAIVPERRADEPRMVAPPAELPHFGRIPLWLLILGAVVIASVVADHSWWSWWPNGPVLAVALVGLGVWLLVRDGEDHGAPGPADSAGPGGPAGPDSTTSTLGGRSTTLDGGLAEPLDASEGAGPSGEFSPPVSPWWSGAETGASGAVAGPTASTVSSERTGRSRVALAVVALLLIGGGLAWLLHVLDVATLSLEDGLAAGLVVVGLGLVVAAWRGRAWSLAAIGLLFASAILLVEVIDVPFEAGAGDRHVVVDTRAELADTHELFAGQLTLDLRRAPLTADTTTLDAAVGMGQLRVIVPRDANVDVDATVKAGNIAGDLAPTPDEGGVDLHETFSAGGHEGGDDLRLELRVGLGELRVDRA